MKHLAPGHQQPPLFRKYVSVSYTALYLLADDNRANSMFAPNQWETALLCNDVYLWLGASVGSESREKIRLQTKYVSGRDPSVVNLCDAVDPGTHFTNMD